MPDPIDELLVSVRADTRGFAADMAAMRSQFDATLGDGFSAAGAVLERSLLAALRKGSLGFDDLKRVGGNAFALGSRRDGKGYRAQSVTLFVERRW